MSQRRTRRAAAATALAVVLAVTSTGCSNDDTSASGTNSQATKQSDNATADSKPIAPIGFTQLVTTHCYGVNGQRYVSISSEDPKTGEQQQTTTFKWPSSDTNTHAVADACARPIYNDDFTRAYVSRFDPESGSSAVGYIDTTDSEGTFHPLSKTPGEFDRIVDIVPSFAAGRVYFYDAAGDRPVLMSMTEKGTDRRSEADLQANFEDLGIPETGNEDRSDDPFVLNTTSNPVMTTVKSEVTFSPDGKLQATWGTDENGKTTIDVTVGEASIEYLVEWPTGYDATAMFLGRKIIGFVDDDTLIVTDGQQILSADLSGEAAQMHLILPNSNRSKSVQNVILSDDRKRLAFSYVLGGTSPMTSLHTMSVTGGIPKLIRKYPAGGIYSEATVLHLP